MLECIDQIGRDHVIIGQAELERVEVIVTGQCGFGINLVGKIVLVIGKQKRPSFVVQQSDVSHYTHETVIVFYDVEQEMCCRLSPGVASLLRDLATTSPGLQDGQDCMCPRDKDRR